MTQTQTTAERIFALIFSNIGYTDGDDRTVASIAAEIDALKAQLAAQDAALVDMPKLAALLATAERERDEARADVERLRPAAEAWLYKQACEAWDAGKITPFEFAEAHKLYSPQARRAREAKGGA